MAKYKSSDIILEVLGERSFLGIDPAKKNNLCPFTRSVCFKKSAKIEDEVYPVCTLKRKTKPGPIIVCPKRFDAIDIIADVNTHVWKKPNIEDLLIASEVKMDGFGNVDYVLAETVKGQVADFVSIEVQAVDITGSVSSVYENLRSGIEDAGTFSFGLNSRNVAKRFLMQLINKGYYHHHWNSKIIAIVQSHMYEYFQEVANFPVSSEMGPNQNIVFMLYDLEKDIETNQFKLVFQKALGTHHSNLQNAILYKTPPAREEFIGRVNSRLV